MAQEQNYQVNYSINVDASQGTKQVIAFGEAVGKLVQAKASLTPAVTNIKNMMDEIDRVFRTKNGKKRNFDYRLTIDTKKSEEKLERIKGLLTDISIVFPLSGRRYSLPRRSACRFSGQSVVPCRSACPAYIPEPCPASRR